MKTYTITESGEVTEVSAFSNASCTVKANTKTEAAKLFLAAHRHAINNPVSLYVRNGAFMLLTPMEKGYAADSGILSRTNEAGRVWSLCSSQHATREQALKDGSFAWYASEEFQNANKAA